MPPARRDPHGPTCSGAISDDPHSLPRPGPERNSTPPLTRLRARRGPRVLPDRLGHFTSAPGPDGRNDPARSRRNLATATRSPELPLRQRSGMDVLALPGTIGLDPCLPGPLACREGGSEVPRRLRRAGPCPGLGNKERVAPVYGGSPAPGFRLALPDEAPRGIEPGAGRTCGARRHDAGSVARSIGYAHRLVRSRRCLAMWSAVHVEHAAADALRGPCSRRAWRRRRERGWSIPCRPEAFARQPALSPSRALRPAMRPCLAQPHHAIVVLP